MRLGTVIVLSLLVVLAATGPAIAAGFVAIEVNGDADTEPAGKAEVFAQLSDKLAEATFMEKWPLILDEVVGCVKDILSQFGLLYRNGD